MYVDIGKIVLVEIRNEALYLTNQDGREWYKLHRSRIHMFQVPVIEDEALWLVNPDQLSEFEQTESAIFWPKLNVSISKEELTWKYHFEMIRTEQENSERSYYFQLKSEEHDFEMELETLKNAHSILSNPKNPNYIRDQKDYRREKRRLLKKIGQVEAKFEAGWPGTNPPSGTTLPATPEPTSPGTAGTDEAPVSTTPLQIETLPPKKPRKGGVKQGHIHPLTALIAVTYHALEKENKDVGRLPTPKEVLDDIKDHDEEKIIQEITDDKTIFWCDPVTRENRHPVKFKTLTNKVSKLRNPPTLPVLL